MGSTPTARTAETRNDVRPRLYLDVDGVLNVLGTPPPDPGHDGWDDVELHEQVPSHAGAFDLRLSRSMVAEVAALDADVAWLTTWRADAVAEVAPLVDAPRDWPWLDWQHDKVEAVVADLTATGPRPFVWIDDVAATRADVDAVAAALPFPVPVHLLVRPAPRSGLRPSELRRVRTFLDAHA